MLASEDILNSYLGTYEKSEDKARFEKLTEALLNASEYSRLSPLSYYIDFIDHLDDVSFQYLRLYHPIQLKRKLYIAYLLLLKDKKHPQHLQACAELIDLLDFNEIDQGEIHFNEYRYATDGHPIKYLGLQAGQWFGERVLEVADASTSLSVDWMTQINEHRLYWVWGGGLLRTVISLIPDTLFDTTNAQTVANSPTRFTGYMSWVMYYTRFAFNLFLLFKHTFAPELTAEEKENPSPYWERFKTQWHMRKYILLNDSLWGIANMVCFYWFLGSDGDLLTVFLLCFDLCSAYYEYEEEQCIYNQQLIDFDNQIAELNLKLEKAKNTETRIDLENKIKKLKKDKVYCDREWKHKRIALINATVYAFALVIAFALATMPFLPIAAPTLLLITTIGAALCFALTVINNGMKQGLEVRKTYMTKGDLKDERTLMIADFKSILLKNKELDDPQKILLFLEIKQLRTDEKYQSELLTYQTLHLIRTMIMQTLIPALLLLSFLFLPMSTGILVVAAGLTLAIMTHLYIEKLYKTEKITFCEFDNVEYQQFCNNPDQWLDKPLVHKDGLFSGTKLPNPGDEMELPLISDKSKPLPNH